MTDPINLDVQGRTYALMQGLSGTGKPTTVPVTGEGHIEVAIHSPRMPFGEVHVESADPIFQVDAVYGINTTESRVTTGNAGGGSVTSSVTGTGNLFTCSTGAAAYAYSSLQSRKRLRYRAGQGVFGRFTGMWSAPAASSIVVAGLGTAESGFYFGYNGTSFGILHSTAGVREIQTLTITTASTSTFDIVIRLNGTNYTVTGITNSASTTKTANEIAKGPAGDYIFGPYTAMQRGSDVVFLANDAGDKSLLGTYTITQTGAATQAAGTWVRTTSGVASTDNWIPQSSWNGDVMDGYGASGVLLNPSKGNVFQIDIQYLGFGAITFKIETSSDGNNADFIVVHTITYVNQNTTPSVTQPSFPFTMAAYSAGSTTNVSVSCASYSGFIAGKKKVTGPRFGFYRETNGFVGSTASTYYPIETIRNDITYNGRANQSIVNMISAGGANDDATPVTLFLLRNATLLGPTNFTQTNSNSCTSSDLASTTCTVSMPEQIILAIPLGQTSGDIFAFTDEITLQPGETITLAARAMTGTATYVNATLNTREDQ